MDDRTLAVTQWNRVNRKVYVYNLCAELKEQSSQITDLTHTDDYNNVVQKFNHHFLKRFKCNSAKHRAFICVSALEISGLKKRICSLRSNVSNEI